MEPIRVNIYHDGKLMRGHKGSLVQRGSKRVAIFFYCDWDETHKVVWFRKVRREGKGVYWNSQDNMWYYPYRETDAFKAELKSYCQGSYWNKLFIHNDAEDY